MSARVTSNAMGRRTSPPVETALNARPDANTRRESLDLLHVVRPVVRDAEAGAQHVVERRIRLAGQILAGLAGEPSAPQGGAVSDAPRHQRTLRPAPSIGGQGRPDAHPSHAALDGEPPR